MKRILVLNYEFPPLGGGASPVSYEIAKRLSETGDFVVEVVTMGYKNLPNYEEVTENFIIHRVKCLRSKKEICHPWEQATYLISAWFKCKALLKKNKYDVCHCHFIIPTGVLALLLKKKFGLEYVITAHGSDVLGYNERFKNLYPLLVGKWQKILDNAKVITSPSNFLKGEILKVYPKFDEKKIVVIPNGIDTNKFRPQEKKKYILSTGRLLANKGFQYLIQAVSEEDLGYEVHIAGDGPMMGELKRLAEKSKTKIIFHGWLDNNGEEYKNLLEQSAVFVLASEKENASISLLEAMSAGCAPLVINDGGSAEMVIDLRCQFEFKVKNSLKRQLNIISTNNILLTELQTEAIDRVKNNYEWNIVIKEYPIIL